MQGFALEELTADAEVSGGSLSAVLRRTGAGRAAGPAESLTPFLDRLKKTSVRDALTSARAAALTWPDGRVFGGSAGAAQVGRVVFPAGEQVGAGFT